MPPVFPVAPALLTCPACGASLGAEFFFGRKTSACPRCRAVLTGAVFPAFSLANPDASSLADTAGEGEAVCFFHPENRAALSCDRCGRFLCAVCDLPLGTRHLCPACLSSGLGGEKLPELVVSRFLWAESALLAGAVPLVIFLFVWPGLIVSGSAAVFLALFGWKKAPSLPRGRRRWMAVLGLVCGVLQLAIWFGFLVLISNSSAWKTTFR